MTALKAARPSPAPAPRITLRRVRLASGLVLAAYIASHLVDHALGTVSLAAMEAGLELVRGFWHLPGTGPALYGALAVHGALGLWAIVARPRLGWRLTEVAQLALGIAVVPLLAQHVVGTRLAEAMFGTRVGYAQVLYYFWITAPAQAALQALALVVAWLHGCIGLHAWLRLKPGYRRVGTPLLVAALLLPVLALIGFWQGGREVVRLAADEGWRIENMPAPAAPRAGAASPDIVLDRIASATQVGWLALAALAFAGRGGRRFAERRRGLVRVTYPGGVVARVTRGTSVLEASRAFNVPHASVCGGRGRCSTCRVRVLAGEPLAPSPDERAVLDRIGGSPDMRLACQFRPERDVTVVPLLSPRIRASDLGRRAEVQASGEERWIAAMFVDMRGSTRLAEGRLPFDTVFVINRFLEAVAAGVTAAGGAPNQFLGDGMMALFGVASPPEVAARQALDAVGRIAWQVETLNELLAAHLDAPIRFGIGLHAGTAILGEIGDRERDRAVFTAIGDPVNVASRLQGQTKRLGVEALISLSVFEAAGLEPDLPAEEVAIDGRTGQIRVVPVASAAAGIPARGPQSGVEITTPLAT